MVNEGEQCEINFADKIYNNKSKSQIARKIEVAPNNLINQQTKIIAYNPGVVISSAIT